MNAKILTTNRVLSLVLDDLSIPHIEERLPRAFFYGLGLKFPQQYGIACRDVAACVRRAEALGAGPFLHTTLAAPNWTEEGELRRDCRLEFALGYAGDTQIEFLGPGEGTNHYARALKDTDIAFHHVGIYQTDMERISGTLEGAGYRTAVRGGLSLLPALKIDFRYFDARHEHDIYLEVLDLQCLTFELPIERIIRAVAVAAPTSRLRQTMGRWRNGPRGVPRRQRER
jgi:hypothetical protein